MNVIQPMRSPRGEQSSRDQRSPEGAASPVADAQVGLRPALGVATAGTMQPLRRRRGPVPAVIRRRTMVRGWHGGQDGFERIPAHPQDIEALITAVDKATQQAHAQVINRPLFTGLESLKDSSGYVGRWVELITAEANPKPPGAALATAFGYAVETLTTTILGATAAGWKLTYQMAVGQTRPDVVATKDGQTVWLDLTADSDSSGEHIYTLKSWNSPKVCPYPHAEIGYQPFDQGARNLAVANARLELQGNPNAATVDAAALTEQLALAKKRHEELVDSWQRRFAAGLQRDLKWLPRGDDPHLMLRRRLRVYQWFNRVFGTAYPITAPILQGTPLPPRKRRSAGESEGQRSTKKARMELDATPRKRKRGSDESEDLQPKKAKVSETDDADDREQEGAPPSWDAPGEPEVASEVGSVLVVLDLGLRRYGFVIGTQSRARGVAFLEEHDNPERLPEAYRKTVKH